MKIRAHVFISGEVQGVFFRNNIALKANELSVNGWVQNLKDGRVEVLFEGNREDIDELIDYCNIGPDPAKVEKVDVEWEPFKGDVKGFRVVY